MRRCLALGIVLMCGSSAAAEEDLQSIREKAAFWMTTGFQCAAVTGDHEGYDAIKASATKELAQAGSPAGEIVELIQQIESEATDGPLTKELCQDLLDYSPLR